MTTTRLVRLSSMVLVLLLVSCFGSSPPKEERFYNLTGPRYSAFVRGGPRLVVASFAAAAGYDSQRLAYRLSPYEIQYYGYRQWVTEPARLFQEWTMRHLRASKMFAEVTSSDRLRDPTAVLYGVVEAVEEVDRGETWLARLSMTFILRQGESEKVVLRHHFDTTRPCARRHPDEVPKEIAKILEKESKRLAERIVSALR